MNSLGWLILSSAAHATAFAAIGCLAYLVVRRLSPAAGALAAAASLVIMGLVSVVVAVPLPEWWTFTVGKSAHNTVAVAHSVPDVDRTRDHGGVRESSSAGGDFLALKQLPVVPRDETSATSAWVDSFLSELRQPMAAVERSSGRWPTWIAIGFVASALLGLARLALGFWSIERLRAGSLPVDDPDMIDMVEVLRAELSCSRPVEVHESALMTTPATIGWKRPLLLLPRDWRSWSTVERRVALSHELAHICRHDFSTGLVAQVSLSLHFYNPLAHWLTARLRLEQELAADAWGALLSGGNQSYVTTLAQMALRRDGRAPSWPARAFLPSRATFVRRIEMLRNARRVRHVPLPRVVRLFTIGALCSFGLLVTAVRTPAVVPSVQAGEQVAGAAKPPVPQSYNLAFVPADAKMLVAVRPQGLLKRPEFQQLVESMKRGPVFKGLLLFPPEEIEQVVVFWDGPPERPVKSGRSPLVPFLSGAVVRTTKPRDWKALIQNTLLGPIRELRHDGQVFFGFQRRGPEDWGAFAPDDRTLVLAREDLLRELIDDREIPAPARAWDEAWKKATKGQVMVVVETRWLRRRVAQGFRGGPSAPAEAANADAKLDTISPLLDKARAYVLAIEASQGIAVDLVALAGTEENAKPIADTVQALLTLGANAVHGMQRDLRGPNDGREAMDWFVEAADLLLGAAHLETSGRFVRLQAKSTVDIAAGLKLVAPALAAANAASLRAQSVNNLKQIGLALHNYHAANNRFPTQVLYGGLSGKFPYSWRVAILPYLEQTELYKRYNFDEPWDGPNNRKLLELMPAVYGYPNPDGSPSTGPDTAYVVFSGSGTALSPSADADGRAGAGKSGARPGLPGAPAGLANPPPVDRQGPRPPSLMDIQDGTSNTILVVEAKRGIPWTKPEDVPFDPNAAVFELGGFRPDGFNAAFADGSVHFIKKSMNPTVLKALITRAGGEFIRLDDPPDPVPAATNSPKR